MPRTGQTKQQGQNMKKAKFQTLAESLEAGEPSLVDKITGKIKPSELGFFWLENGMTRLIADSVFKTLSGEYVIIAHERTTEEAKARDQQLTKNEHYREMAEKKRIEAAMSLPGYILFGWQKPYGVCYREVTNAYYLSTTGPRFVYVKQYKIVWKQDDRGAGYKTAEPDRDKFSRWGRKMIAERIKKKQDDVNLCAPLWLLTSIPDPRPRFLAGEE